jgi:undecaprenyl-diphosphatase
MDWIQSLILGTVQGLTEYLPISSSGHLAIGQALFGLQDPDANLAFTVTVHIATVLSTCFILWKEIVWIFADLFKFKWNNGTKYAFNILISMIPVAVVGFFFKDKVEEVFGSGLLIVGICLMITATLLAFSYFAKPRQRENISPIHAFVIGIAQAIAVLPGLSRSGSTIATGLLLGNKKEKLAQFSFLMVIPPILGEALLDTKDMAEQGISAAMGGISPLALAIGFLAAFISGCIACKWMINLVKKGKLIWFAVYCAVVGLATIIIPLLG